MVRRAIKYFLVNCVALYLISLVVTGMMFVNGVTTIILTGIALSLASFVIRPVINLLLLPLNLITFGLFRWVSYAITLYIVTLIVPGFKIVEFIFKGFSSSLISIPAISLSGIGGLILFSFVISFVSSFFEWLLK
jgi:putative membrane protein